MAQQNFAPIKLIPDNPSVTDAPPVLELRLIDGKSKSTLREFLFAVTPQSLALVRHPLTSVYYTAGDSSTGGVSTVADVYGMTPPVWTIQGTPGIQSHSAVSSTTNRRIVTNGRQALEELKAFLIDYQNRVADARAARLPIPIIHLNDGINAETWEVVPAQTFSIAWGADTPFWGNYNLSFAGINDLSKPRRTADSLFGETFATNPNAANNTAYAVVGRSYVPSDYVSSYLQANPNSTNTQAINAYLTSKGLPQIGG